MRMIDADALLFMSDNKYDDRKIPINRIRKWIEKAPTVDAIPIDELEERIEMTPITVEINGTDIYVHYSIERVVRIAIEERRHKNND